MLCIAATKCKYRHIIHAAMYRFFRQLQFDALLLFWCVFLCCFLLLSLHSFIHSYFFDIWKFLFAHQQMCVHCKHTHEFRTIWINKFCIFANSTMEYTSFNNCRWRYAALMWNTERTNDRLNKTQWLKNISNVQYKWTYMLKHYTQSSRVHDYFSQHLWHGLKSGTKTQFFTEIVT